ncbi:hypothetical protein GCM10007160_00050 [Litchfieldella qijiaojingensis]|uniref:Uncharacterized protein n=1 Tax=Litchfieldella qijiaojingensis TaxID=980347 RepID=A0ABQ2YBG4_9GAMM|nr:hypothetical protein GCM10007160_00050 [Halomonas qijiaojingensis]
MTLGRKFAILLIGNYPFNKKWRSCAFGSDAYEVISAHAESQLLAEWRTLVYPDGMDKAAFMHQSGHLAGGNSVFLDIGEVHARYKTT